MQAAPLTRKKIAYSDLHLKLSDPLGVPTPDGLNSRIHQKVALLNKVIDVAIKEKCDEIFDFGDLYDSINPPSKVRNIYARTISRAIAAGIKVTRICGNHETDGREPDGLDAAILGGDFYSVVMDIQKHPEFSDLLLIPEISYDKIAEALKDTNSLVFGHFQVIGATYPNGITADTGIPSSLYRSRKFPIYLGHIHKRQVIGDNDVVYVGALAKHDFGDAEIPTGCCVFELDYRTFYVTQGEGPYKRLEAVRHKFIPIEDVGMQTLKFTQDEKEPQESEIKVGEGDIVKLVYSGTHEWFSGCNPKKWIQLLEKLGARVIGPDFRSKVVYNELIEESQEIDLLTLVSKKADLDKQSKEFGLNYFKKAMEVTAHG